MRDSLGLLQTLSDFLKGIEKDPRIRVTHIAVYMALYQRWVVINGIGPVHFWGRELMAAAKISSSVTYHRAIRALDEYGYIRYKPSFNKLAGSKAYLQF